MKSCLNCQNCNMVGVLKPFQCLITKNELKSYEPCEFWLWDCNAEQSEDEEV